MLTMAIIATVLLSIRILIGWVCKLVRKSNQFYGLDEATQGFCKGLASWGLFNIYILVTIWVLYGCIG